MKACKVAQISPRSKGPTLIDRKDGNMKNRRGRRSADRLLSIGDRGNAGGLPILIQIKADRLRSWLTIARTIGADHAHRRCAVPCHDLCGRRRVRSDFGVGRASNASPRSLCAQERPKSSPIRTDNHQPAQGENSSPAGCGGVSDTSVTRNSRSDSRLCDRSGHKNGRALKLSHPQIRQRIVGPAQGISNSLGHDPGLPRDRKELVAVLAGEIGDREQLPLLP